jgi:hypothetical protein
MMRTGAAFWLVFLGLGVLLYVESLGVWTHPPYRALLMVTALFWSRYVVRVPKANRPATG